MSIFWLKICLKLQVRHYVTWKDIHLPAEPLLIQRPHTDTSKGNRREKVMVLSAKAHVQNVELYPNKYGMISKGAFLIWLSFIVLNNMHRIEVSLSSMYLIYESWDVTQLSLQSYFSSPSFDTSSPMWLIVPVRSMSLFGHTSLES